MDDTLVSHNDSLGVLVKSPGKKAKRYSTLELADRKKLPGEKYDWKEFRSADIFASSSKPMFPVIAKLKQLSKKYKVEVLTGRADLDNQELFATTLAKHGIDISKIHVHRVGNMRDFRNTAQRKAIFISRAINKYNYCEIHLYDDSKINLDAFMALKDIFPQVKFHAHHVTKNKRGQIRIRKHH